MAPAAVLRTGPARRRVRKGTNSKSAKKKRRTRKKNYPKAPGLTEFQCTSTGVVNPDGEASSVGVEAYVDLGKVHEGDTLENTATVSGGGAGELTVHETAAVSSAATPFGLQLFTAWTTGPGGEAYTQAAGARTRRQRDCSSTPLHARGAGEQGD